MRKTLDIGCSGFTRTFAGYEDAEAHGIDIVDHPESPHIMQADLTLEDIPFEDNTFDLVTAYDFLEHLPMVLYLPTSVSDGVYITEVNVQRRDVMIELFNEVYRVLKPGGLFYIQTPIHPDKSIFQDPQHQSFWTDDTLNYFSGDYVGFHDHYGHKSRFAQLNKQIVNNHIYATLVARKDIPGDHPYLLNY